MELKTRCPECETVFPVSLEQLQLRKGYIRCIQCAHIFDGFDAAVPGTAARPGAGDTPPAAAEPVIPAQELASSSALPPEHEAPAHQAFVIPEPENFHIETPEPARPFSIGAAPPAMAVPESEHFSEPALASGPAPVLHDEPEEPQVPSVLRQRTDRRGAAVAIGPSFTISEPGERTAGARRPTPITIGDPPADDSDEPLYIEPREARRSERYKPEFPGEHRERAWLAPVWALLLIVGLVLLCLQGVHVYRAQLANNFPGLRPTLEAACERLQCDVPYERHIEAIAITGSALRSSGAPDGEVSNLLLEVTLRNTHERPQEWPTLVLDLKDASGTVVVRRNMGPDIWVPAELRDGPFSAGSELKVQLPVAVRGLQANGYQLDKFFP